QVRKQATGTSKAVICLELAATSIKLPLDKEYDVKLSVLNKKPYQSTLKSHLGLGDLAVQFGCMDTIKVATQILERYEVSLPAAQQKDVDLSKPLFTTAALNSACKCLKIKVDRKLLASSGAKKGILTGCAPSSRNWDRTSAREYFVLSMKDSEECAAQDYEEWKRRILENALKANA
uniref:Origin recognition complex subunit 6 n=1 Tax=Salmo trutta TaxID=8032 RepID=A0A674F2R1_SALTR